MQNAPNENFTDADRLAEEFLIAEHIWDINFDSNTHVVDVVIRRIRAKIDDSFTTKLIHTIRGVGYVLRSERA